MTQPAASEKAPERPVIEDPKECLLDVVRKMRVLAGGLTEQQAQLLNHADCNVVAVAKLVCGGLSLAQLAMDGAAGPEFAKQAAERVSALIAKEAAGSGAAKERVLSLVDDLEALVQKLSPSQCEALDPPKEKHAPSAVRVAHAIVLALRIGQLGASGQLSGAEIAAYTMQLVQEGSHLVFRDT